MTEDEEMQRQMWKDMEEGTLDLEIEVIKQFAEEKKSEKSAGQEKPKVVEKPKQE
jgi:hypothetical protein